MRFKDKVVAITGGGAGIGLATSELFAAEGAIVAINDVSADTAGAAVESIHATGGRAMAIPGDISDHDVMHRSIDQVIAAFGRIDVLINNAGVMYLRAAEDYETFDHSLSVNLHAPFYWSQTVAKKSMIPNRSGSIVMVSSLAGLAPLPGDVGYAAAKHGLIGLAKALSLEWIKHNVRVNCTAPGLTTSAAYERTKRAEPEFLAQREARIPIGRVSTTMEQARVIAFLASDDAAYVTGVTIPVDGGQMAVHSGYAPRPTPPLPSSGS